MIVASVRPWKEFLAVRMSRLMNSLIRCHNDAMIKFASPTVTEQRFGQALKVPKLWCLKAPVALYEVVVTCVTPEGRPHPHRLEGPHCRDGICVMRGGNTRELSYTLFNIGKIIKVPALNIHLAGRKFSKVRPKEETLKDIISSKHSEVLEIPFKPPFKLRPVDEKQVKASGTSHFCSG